MTRGGTIFSMTTSVDIGSSLLGGTGKLKCWPYPEREEGFTHCPGSAGLFGAWEVQTYFGVVYESVSPRDSHIVAAQGVSWGVAEEVCSWFEICGDRLGKESKVKKFKGNFLFRVYILNFRVHSPDSCGRVVPRPWKEGEIPLLGIGSRQEIVGRWLAGTMWSLFKLWEKDPNQFPKTRSFLKYIKVLDMLALVLFVIYIEIHIEERQ